ncbi:multiple inositol polyphosphate phosphatase [Tuber magnatum]|uniref:3-phytase n=1 Tax=Tuber magnatum TaxID=42249 RepID=A0A317SSC4_9PEZI|nr:multiple inositol polyphosphate phosphatase [Tuber magnatum]
MKILISVLAGLLALTESVVTGSQEKGFETLQWLGANSPWFAGPNVFGISEEVPSGCKVEQAAQCSYIVRHGSRYPDPGAYQEWQAFSSKIKSSNMTATGPLEFLSSWSPVPVEIGQLSVTGYAELYTLGTTLRFRYPEFYSPNTPFSLWANDYPRTIDSVRLFARGYLGPNSSLADVYVIDPKDPRSVMNSLAPSDLCPLYRDDSGNQTKVWDGIYLPPIKRRLRSYLTGTELSNSEIGLIPYLCGFETQITGRQSPFCGIFEKEEILQYEYRQDLRYWHGTGPGSGLESTMMLPFLTSLVDLFTTGQQPRNNSSGFSTPPLTVAFTHDNQINQLAAAVGVFDAQRELSPDKPDPNRIFTSSRINPMRGTVTLENLKCSGSNYIRIKLNDAVYPIPTCQNGPGRTCPLDTYAKLIRAKNQAAGDWKKNCGVAGTGDEVTESFFKKVDVPWIRVVKP